MQITFRCPACQQQIRAEIPDSEASVECAQCDWSRPVRAADVEDGKPAKCVVCGCGDLWRQKDFPQWLGLLLVGIGALLSTIAWAYRWPVTAIGILMGFALADLTLYTLMKDLLVCYRCGAQHRRANLDDDHPRFNLEVLERYRQEAKRLTR